MKLQGQSADSSTQDESQVYVFGAFRLDTAVRELRKHDECVALAPKVFDTLVVLVKNRNRIVKKDELIGAVWPNAFVSDDSLTLNIWALRRALGDDTTGTWFTSARRSG